jgi:hypothetical protein
MVKPALTATAAATVAMAVLRSWEEEEEEKGEEEGGNNFRRRLRCLQQE